MLGLILVISGFATSETNSVNDKGHEHNSVGIAYKCNKTGQIKHLYEDSLLLQTEIKCRKIYENLYKQLGKSWDSKGIQIGTDKCLTDAGFERIK